MSVEGPRGRGPYLALVFVVAAGAAWLILSWLAGDDAEGARQDATVRESSDPPVQPGPQEEQAEQLDPTEPPGQEPPAPGSVVPAKPPVAGPAPEPEAPHEPVFERGLALRLEPLLAGGGEPDTRRARMVSLHVERGSSPSVFLKPGPFRATWTGRLPVPIRDRYGFQALGKGSVQVTINDTIVLEGRLGGDTAIDSQPVRLRKGDNDVRVVFESGPMGDGALRLHWSSAEFGWEPIAPELWSHDAAEPALVSGERLRLGRELVAVHRCTRCHLPEEPFVDGAMPELAWSGPDLRGVGARVRPGFLLRWLRNPRATRPDAHMPGMHWADPERDPADIAAWLAGQGEPATEADPPGPVLVEEGEARFYELGCIACHVPPAEPADRSTLGDRIHLGYAVIKWRSAALTDYLRQPSRHYPHVRMPDFELSEEDAAALTAFLLSGEQVADEVPEGDPARGAELVAAMGCARCHEVGVDDVSAFDGLAELDPTRGCLSRSSGAPDHGLSEPEVEALRAFLRNGRSSLHRAVPTEFALRAVKSLRCTACHAFDGEPSAWNSVVQDLSRDEPLPEEMDPVAQGVPSLTWAGSKLQPEWMTGFVTGKLDSPRPWLVARMPAFREHGEMVVTGLLHQHGYAAAPVAREEPDPALAAHGRRLIQMGEGFGCVQCHGLAERPPVQVFERQGIDFDRVTGRLRKEYYTRWLADPPRIDPESRMPKYADDRGKTAFTEVLGGDAARQFEAIWHFLLTLR